MKFEVEKKITANNLSQNNAMAQIRTILLTVLTSSIEKKIDWASSEDSIKASVYVMNSAEWEAAKGIIKSIAEEFPETTDKIIQILGIIDPLLPGTEV